MSGDKLADVLPIGGVVASMTEEEWAAHDARVAEERSRNFVVSHLPVDDGYFMPTATARGWNSSLKGWPRRAIEATETADKTHSAITQLLAWDHEDRSIAVLAGPAGTGKTVAAASWAKAKAPRCVFVRAATFATSSRYDSAARSQWYDAPALCLDDLGAEYLDAKGSFLVDLDELVDTYYADKRPLVITTNSDAATFKARYGVRIVDRLRECGKWFAVQGQSMRGAK